MCENALAYHSTSTIIYSKRNKCLNIHLNLYIRSKKICVMAWSLLCNEKTIVLFEKTGMRLRSQRPSCVQGDASHPGQQGGGQKNKKIKKWRAEEEEERYKGSLTPKSNKICESTGCPGCPRSWAIPTSRRWPT
jgi:hypothetical protein